MKDTDPLSSAIVAVRSPDTLFLRIDSLDDVFDPLDPEPLPRRKLAPEFLSYIFDAMDGLPRKQPMHLSLHVPADMLNEWKSDDLLGDLQYQLARHWEALGRKLRENFRLGRTTIVLGIVVLALFVTLSQISAAVLHGGWQRTLEEGFLIIGTVALWRPVEILLYDWWPIYGERQKVKQLIAGTIRVKAAQKRAVRRRSA